MTRNGILWQLSNIVVSDLDGDGDGDDDGGGDGDGDFDGDGDDSWQLWR